ncbi:glycosyltransferase family 4 protein [Cohnella nanjingensis]|uniref:Glycosyltransferase family 4 protein n=1 Tax=Cohnella nanjingensis TaxID=1387779 RepID=A0A7X0RWQ9_9BACL|nr:glycosyltransferase family 4 protein [Cohnella nanjingensis]MBB6675005.1 glycosyltransferase family 4 protein [Cohnella nanjingensis]
MKILLATYWPVPHIGGVWPFMLQLRNRLETLGHEVDLLGNGDDSTNSFIQMIEPNRKISKDKLLPLLKAKLNLTSDPVFHANPLVQYAEFQRHMFELAAAYFNISDYDIIHTQDVISTTAMARVRQRSTALVATLHGCVAHEIRNIKHPTNYIAHTYYNAIEHTGATVAEITHVANQWLKRILTDEFKVPDEQLKVFPYGFDVDNFSKRMKEKADVEHPSDKKVIIFTGRLVELKGIHHLLAALGKLKAKRKDWVCWIVGDGAKKEELLNQSKTLGLEREVQFMGKRDDIPALLRLADIFVLPSLTENQSVSLIEAQIAGKATVVSKVGGLPEMVEHDVTGLLYPVGDIDALTRGLDKLLADEEYRTKLGMNAHKWGMKNWSMNAMTDNLLKVYKTAIEKRRQGRSL